MLYFVSRKILFYPHPKILPNICHCPNPKGRRDNKNSYISCNMTGWFKRETKLTKYKQGLKKKKKYRV